jgi:elongation factor 1-alpha
MTAFSPNYLDYLLLVISAEVGISETTEDFLNFAKNMDLPIITVITKVDLISEEKKKELILSFKSKVNEVKYNRLPLIIKTNDDVVLFSRNIQEKSIIPLFLVSNLHWEGLNLMKSFLSMLPVNDIQDELKSIENEKIEVKLIYNF